MYYALADWGGETLNGAGSRGSTRVGQAVTNGEFADNLAEQQYAARSVGLRSLAENDLIKAELINTVPTVLRWMRHITRRKSMAVINTNYLALVPRIACRSLRVPWALPWSG